MENLCNGARQTPLSKLIVADTVVTWKERRFHLKHSSHMEGGGIFLSMQLIETSDSLSSCNHVSATSRLLSHHLSKLQRWMAWIWTRLCTHMTSTARCCWTRLFWSMRMEECTNRSFIRGKRELILAQFCLLRWAVAVNLQSIQLRIYSE